MSIEQCESESDLSSSGSSDLDDIYTAIGLTEEEFQGAAVGMMQQPSFVDMVSKILTGMSSKKERDKPIEAEIPFCISSSLPLIPLHPDLVTEPYTSRASLSLISSSTRPFFLFNSDGSSVLAGTHGDFFIINGISSGSLARSYISIVDVYDVYGLEMTYSYMHHLYHSQISLRNPRWLTIYILGSLTIICPGLAATLYDAMKKREGDSDITLAACSILLTELVLLDSREPKLSVPIEPHTTTLPLDILARIFNSKLISKDIAERVDRMRRHRELRPGEIECRARHERVIYHTRGEEGMKHAELFLLRDLKTGTAWILVRDDSRFSLTKEKCNLTQTAGIVLYSPRDYARFWHTNLHDTFSKMLSDVALSDEQQICAWIVMLANELGDEKLEVEGHPRELVPLFLGLKRDVLSKLRGPD